MTTGSDQQKWYKSLAFRLALLLSVALVPIGFLAVYQTEQVKSELELRSERALLTATEAAASREKRRIDQALGAADAAVPVLAGLTEDTARCTTYMANLVTRLSGITFAGLLDEDGELRCRSRQAQPDRALLPDGELKALQRISLRVPPGELGEPVLVLETPVFDEDGTLDSVLVLFLDTVSLEIPNISGQDRSDIDLITFNRDGGIISMAGQSRETSPLLPQDLRLPELTSRGTLNFTGLARDGTERSYAVVPIVPTVLYALGTWSQDGQGASQIDRLLGPTTLPLIMWLVSLVVAYIAIHYLVIRHIRDLSLQMRRFARNREIEDTGTERLPGEFAIIQSDFQDMASSLLHDEARLEDNVREKNILLKEVHHRVKNNLQLISSIMNMTIRKAENPESVVALRRVQDRVLSLAAMHRTLYTSQDVGRVNAASIIKEVVLQTCDNSHLGRDAVALRFDFDEIELLPDQAVPLSLLVAEVITADLSKKAAAGFDMTEATLSLKRHNTHEARLQISVPHAGDDEGADALHPQLIAAFSAQLNAHISQVLKDDQDVFTATFSIEGREFAQQDY